MTATLAPPEPQAGEPQAPRDWRSVPRWAWALLVVAARVVVHAITKGTDTLARPVRVRTELTDRFTEFNNDVLASRDTNPIIKFTYGLGERFVEIVDWLQRMVFIANLPRPVPEVGWLGVAVAAVSVALVIANWRIAILVALSFLSFGYFGFWSSAIDLLIVTFVAVAVSVLIGMPLAIWIASSRRANGVVTAFLDVMQTMPTFVYLVPVVLFFGIGASAAVVCTLIYSLPPLIRIAGHGIRWVSPTTIEATDSAGQTFRQRLFKVQLPMARATIVVGLNQTIMAALAMATIAAYVNGPGLGKDVLRALADGRHRRQQFVPGALIVVMAIMLDRTATAASLRSDRVARGGGRHRGAAPSGHRRGCGGDGRRLLPVPVLQLGGRVPRERVGPPSCGRGELVLRLVHRHLRSLDARVQGRDHCRAAEPAGVPALGVAVGPRRVRYRAAGVRCRRTPCAGRGRGRPDCAPPSRLLEHNDGHAQHDAGGHPVGDDDGAGVRGVDGPQQTGRHRASTVAGCGSDNSPSRFITPGGGAVREPESSPRSWQPSSMRLRWRSNWWQMGSRGCRQPRWKPPGPRAPPGGRRSSRFSCPWHAARSSWPRTRASCTCWRWSSSAAWWAVERSATTSCSGSRARRSGPEARWRASASWFSES